MVELSIIGALAALTTFFFLRWRDEKVRADRWKEALLFAQTEVTRWKKEAEHWAVAASCSNGLVETELRLPNIDEVLARKD